MRIEGIIAAFAVVLGAITLAACGDDTEPLTRADFIEQADAACERANTAAAPTFDAFWSQFDDFDMDTADGQTEVFVAMAEVIDAVGPIWRTMADEIAALEPPPDDAEYVNELVADLRTSIDEMETTVDAAVAGDVEAREALDDDDPMSDVNRRARNYGMQVCGQDE